MKIPETMTDPIEIATYERCNDARRSIKEIAIEVDGMRHNSFVRQMNPDVGANITLAYRHLEDASMRLGKALQALDGGVSVYDRKTTVGA